MPLRTWPDGAPGALHRHQLAAVLYGDTAEIFSPTSSMTTLFLCSVCSGYFSGCMCYTVPLMDFCASLKPKFCWARPEPSPLDLSMWRGLPDVPRLCAVPLLMAGTQAVL